MSNEIRDFIPGACAGSAAELFAGIDHTDQATDASDPRLIKAVDICRSQCPQRASCEEQREDITKVLGARGVGRTVVGGRIVQTPKPEDPYAAVLYEPNFTFDLTQVPQHDSSQDSLRHDEAPRQKLEILRQGLRVGQISLRGKHSKTLDLGAHLHDRLCDEYGDQELRTKGIDPENLSNFMSIVMLRYAFAQCPEDRDAIRDSFPAADEVNDAEALQRLIVADALILSDAGAYNPLDIAKFHKPELFLAIVEKYKSGFDLTPGEIRRVFKRSTSNPLPALARLVAKKHNFRDAKDKGQLPGKGEIVPREVSVSAFTATKLAQLKNEDASLRLFINKPYMRNYVTLIINHNSKDPASGIRSLHKRIKTLQREYEDLDITAIAYIAYHHKEDTKTALGVFREVLDDLNRTYGDNPDLSDKVRQQLAFEHMADAPSIAKEYLSRLKQLRELCALANIAAGKGFERQYAMKFTRPITVEDVSKAHNMARLTFNYDKKFKKAPTWIRERVVELYDKDDHIEVARNATTFLRRGYVEIAYLKSTDGIEKGLQYDRFDPKRGAYLAWSEDFMCLKPEEREAILFVFGLDRLVIGRDVDEAALKEYFQTDNLTQYVDTRLLPHTVQRERYYRSPSAVLDSIRQWVRDHPNKLRQGVLKGTLQTQIDELFDGLVNSLATESSREYPLQDKELQKRLKMIIHRVIVAAPGALLSPSGLRDVALEYLHQAKMIKILGIREPYRIALGYNSAFCEQFMKAVKRQMPELPESRSAELIWRTTTGQAMPLFRRYQQLINEMSPGFQQRRIPPVYCRDACWHNLFDRDAVARRLQAYDKARKKYAGNPKVSSGIIRRYHFLKAGDPLKEIEDWSAAVESVSDDYKRQVGMRYIRRAAITKRDEKLVSAIKDGLEKFESRREHYRQAPHPAVDDEVIHYAIFNASDPDDWLKHHKVRWEKLHQLTDVSDIEPRILRKLVTIHTTDPYRAVEGYRKLCRKYAEDPYIEQEMIDKAIEQNIGQAFVLLGNMRSLMKKSEVRLDEDRTRNGKPMVNHELIGDNSPSPHEVLFGPDDQEAQEQKQAQSKKIIARFFETAPPMEKAAIAVAYNVPWLMPSDMDEDDEDKVYAFYNVESREDLVLIADRLLTQTALT